MTAMIRPIVFVAMFWGFVSAGRNACSEDVKNAQMLQVLSEGHLANREEFGSLTCRFRIIRGHAASHKAAFTGDLTNAVARRGLWIVKGKKVRYEFQCEDANTEAFPRIKDVEKKDASGWLATACNSEKLVGDEALGIDYSRGLEAANLFPRERRGLRVADTPFAMGVMGRDGEHGPTQSRQGVSGPVSYEYVGSATVDGRTLHVIANFEKGKAWRKEWYIDVDQGYLPVEVQWFDAPGELGAKTVVTKVRKCSNGAYMPERSVSINLPKGPPPYSVNVIELVSIDLTEPLDAEFAITLPAGTAIVNVEDMRQFVRLKTEETIHLHELSKWRDNCRDAGRERTGAVPAPSGSRAAAWCAIAAIGGAFMAATIVLVLRNRRDSSSISSH